MHAPDVVHRAHWHRPRLLSAAHLHPCADAALRSFIKCLQGWKGKLLESGYDTIVFEDPMDMLLQLAQAILIGPGIEGGLSSQQLLDNFRDDTWSNTVVMLLRFITSAEIKRRHDHFEPFVLVGQRTR